MNLINTGHDEDGGDHADGERFPVVKPYHSGPDEGLGGNTSSRER